MCPGNRATFVPDQSANNRVVALLEGMAEAEASDLFLTAGKIPHLRVYGNMKPMPAEDEVTEAELEAFVNDALPPATLDRVVRERDIDIGLTLRETSRYRLNFFYQSGQLALVARRVPLGNLTFDALRLPAVMQQFAETERGLLLITGSTGCGKSSSMAALLHHINQTQRKHIITVEDPIEFIHRDDRSIIAQREVGNDTHTFADSLRHVVRQSPDVIFIGEMRDLETIETAISAAMTGHLVISTMHTVDPAQTVERILGYVPESQRDQLALDLSLALVGVVSQRLLHTRKEEGLIPAFEILVNTPMVSQAIAKRQLDDIPELIKAGLDDGMTTFTRTLTDLVLSREVEVETALAAATNREELILAVQGMETGVETLRQRDEEGEHKVVSMRSLLRAAIKFNASDLLITAGRAPLVRIKGRLTELDLDPLTAHDTQRLMFSLLSPPQRRKLESEREIDFALSLSSLQDSDEAQLVDHRFRVNGFYQKNAVSGALRIIPRQIPTVRELRLPAKIMELTELRQGLILVTGPTGAGKSTTQACMIDRINRSRACHIITVEDPIEYVHSHQKAVAEQREVYADTTSFAHALKYVLRQDPDVILIGEMRDPETMAAALQAAETGHLVIATLHTNDAAQTVDRVVDAFPAHQQSQIRMQLAGCLSAVIAQILLPGLEGDDQVACFELMLGTPAVRALIRDERTHQINATIETSAKYGMITMEHALENLYKQGLISQATMERYQTPFIHERA